MGTWRRERRMPDGIHHACIVSLIRRLYADYSKASGHVVDQNLPPNQSLQTKEKELKTENTAKENLIFVNHQH